MRGESEHAVCAGANKAQSPHWYSRRVLLAVAGNTPQILTETLYALVCGQTPAFVPTEVHVMTTAEGQRRMCDQLFVKGRFEAFCAEFGFAGRINFSPAHVHVIADAEGTPLADIRTPEDNSLAADRLVSWLRMFASDPDCALHVSLAGGRKTMGFYLAYALSLYGRTQDRLSHVLVSAEFESSPDFFWPPHTPAMIRTRRFTNGSIEERSLSTADAQVHLADIPFVRLREWLPDAFLRDDYSYMDAVSRAQVALPDGALRIDFAARSIDHAGVRMKLEPKLFAFYAWLACRRHRLGERAWLPRILDAASGAEYTYFYWLALGMDDASPRYAKARQAYCHGLRKDEWANPIHHLRRRLRAEFGRSRAALLEIISRPINGAEHEECALAFPGKRIVLVGLVRACNGLQPDWFAWPHKEAGCETEVM